MTTENTTVASDRTTTTAKSAKAGSALSRLMALNAKLGNKKKAAGRVAYTIEGETIAYTFPRSVLAPTDSAVDKAGRNGAKVTIGFETESEGAGSNSETLDTGACYTASMSATREAKKAESNAAK